MKDAVTFTAIAYSGAALFPDDGSLPRVYDLSTLNFSTPMRFCSEHDEGIGIVHSAAIQENELVVRGHLFTRLPIGRAIVDSARSGKVWHASCSFLPVGTVFKTRGNPFRLNGQVFHGPHYIISNGQIDEVSVTARPRDSRTIVKFDTSPVRPSVSAVPRRPESAKAEEYKRDYIFFPQRENQTIQRVTTRAKAKRRTAFRFYLPGLR